MIVGRNACASAPCSTHQLAGLVLVVPYPDGAVQAAGGHLQQRDWAGLGLTAARGLASGVVLHKVGEAAAGSAAEPPSPGGLL